MFAVIKTGGKQYIVSPGDKIKIEKILEEEGKEVSFKEVLLIEEGKSVQIGTPFVKGAKVTGKVLKQDRDKKITILKYKPKKRYQKKMGHRQPFTFVEIKDILLPAKKSTA